MARLQEKYKKEIVPALVTQFGYGSPQRAPRLEKIAVNMGIGAAAQDGKLLDKAIEEMRLITGQQPVLGRARRSIANFKLREGQAIGVYVTLRRDRMYEFFDRLISLALPRVRDFRGVNPNGFDHRGNYTMGIKEHTIFPEINLDQVERIKGLNISIVTTAETDEEALALLKAFGVPFRKRD